MNKPTDHHARVEALRDQIAEIRDQIESAVDACVPVADALARVDEYVNAAARRAYAGNAAGRFEQQRYHPPALMDEQGALSQRQAFEFIAWVDPETLRKRLHAEVKARYEQRGDTGITDKERRERTVKLTAQLFELECEEERAICNAETVGVWINRRTDADPRAILEATE